LVISLPEEEDPLWNSLFRIASWGTPWLAPFSSEGITLLVTGTTAVSLVFLSKAVPWREILPWFFRNREGGATI